MNKRIIVIFLCLLLIIVPTVLLSAVFVIRDVKVVAMDEGATFDEPKVVGDSGISLKSSIFVLSEDNVIFNIERKNPHIKVVKIEKIFPSKVMVHVTTRVPLFAVGVKGTAKYALVDRELRVVEIVDRLDNDAIVDYTQYQLDLGESITIDDKIVRLNDNEVGGYVIANVVKGFEEKEYPVDHFVSFVKKVTFDKKVAKIVTRDNAVIEVYINSNIKMDELLMSGISYYESDTRENKAGLTYYFDIEPTDASKPSWKVK